MLIWAMRSVLLPGGGRCGAVQRGADFHDGPTERRGGLGPGRFEFALAGARLVQFGGKLGAILIEQPASLGARGLQAQGEPLFQHVYRLLKPPGPQVQGAFAAHRRPSEKAPACPSIDLRRRASAASAFLDPRRRACDPARQAPLSLRIPMPARLQTMADAIRVLSMDAVHRAKSGHQGMPMGMSDVATVLFTKFLKYDASKPEWADRDRFVLSAGHGSMLLYSLLHLTGVKAVTMEQIKNFRQLGSNTPGHPEYGHTPGVETTTGPLGQGLATAVGMAMAERHVNARFGDTLVDHRTWVVAGDGCLMEGVSHEAISLAGRFKLAKLTVLFDDNNTTIDGEATIAETGDQVARFKAAGWAVKAVDGHDFAKIAAALRWATRQDRPTLIACKTKISKGAGPKEGDPHSHGYTLFDPEIAAARAAMGWTAEPFTVPDEVLKPWRAAGRKGAKVRKAWEAALAASEHAPAFNHAIRGELGPD